jgi:hypothetical protein
MIYPAIGCVEQQMRRFAETVNSILECGSTISKSVFEKSSLEFRLQAAGREKPRKRGTPNATGRVRSDFPNTLYSWTLDRPIFALRFMQLPLAVVFSIQARSPWRKLSVREHPLAMEIPQATQAIRNCIRSEFIARDARRVAGWCA